MAAMRYSRVKLTMNYYTAPVLTDATGAVNAMPRYGTGRTDRKTDTA